MYNPEAEVWLETDQGIIFLDDEYQNESSFQASENFPTALFYDSVRVMLGDYEHRLADAYVKDIIREARQQMTTAEFGFFKKVSRAVGRGIKKVGKGIKKVGKTAIKFGKKALPVIGKIAQIAAPIVGTALGGPVGAMLGGVVAKGIGSLAKGQKIGGVTGKALGAVSGITGLLKPGQPASQQLLGLIQNPAFLQSLLGNILGGAKGGSISLGSAIGEQEKIVPFGAFANLMSELSKQAALEANEAEDFPSYLTDEYGEFLIDSPELDSERAQVLLQLLNANEVYSFENQSNYTTQVPQDPLTEWLIEAKILNIPL